MTQSVSERWSLLNWVERARETYQINQAWSHQKFVTRSLSSPWRQPYHPILALSSKRLVVSAGNAITSYRFGYDRINRQSVVEYEGSHLVFPSIQGDPNSILDITGLTFLPDGETLLVSNFEGTLVRVRISPDNDGAIETLPKDRNRREADRPLQASRTAIYDVKIGRIRTLTSSGTIAVSVAESGQTAVVNSASPWMKPAIVNIGKVTWSSHLELDSSTPYLALGTRSSVSVYPFSDGVLRASPTAELGGPGRGTPVYCVAQYIPGGSPDILASGWYDGKVRIHDLRCSQRTWSLDSTTLGALAPVMTLSDPWRSFDPVYSLAARGMLDDEGARRTGCHGGGGGLAHQHHYLTAGSSFHSVVCLWDVRQPSESWSLFAPGGDRSPVHSLKTEGSRIWGVTERRAFVVDFAPDAASTRFPDVERGAHHTGNPYLHRYGSRLSLKVHYKA